MNKESRDYLRQYARQHKAYENKYVKVIYRGLKDQAERVINHVANGGTLEGAEHFISTLPIQRAIERLYVEVGSASAVREYERMVRHEPTKASPAISFFSEIWMAFMRSFALNEAADMIKDITDVTKQRVRFALAEAAEKQLTYRETAKLIREYTLNEYGRARELTITRTEVSTAANMGKKLGAEKWATDYGVELYQKWWVRIDGRERDSHRNMESAKPIPKGEKFRVSKKKGGFDLMEGPCDLTASGENRINCRCVRQYMSAGKAKREYGA